jgi:hypothetical protein
LYLAISASVSASVPSQHAELVLFVILVEFVRKISVPSSLVRHEGEEDMRTNPAWKEEG